MGAALFGKPPPKGGSTLGSGALRHSARSKDIMIVLGIILLVISYVVGFAVLWTIGIILVVIASSCGSWDPSGTRSPSTAALLVAAPAQLG